MIKTKYRVDWMTLGSPESYRALEDFLDYLTLERWEVRHLFQSAEGRVTIISRRVRRWWQR